MPQRGVRERAADAYLGWCSSRHASSSAYGSLAMAMIGTVLGRASALRRLRADPELDVVAEAVLDVVVQPELRDASVVGMPRTAPDVAQQPAESVDRRLPQVRPRPPCSRAERDVDGHRTFRQCRRPLQCVRDLLLVPGILGGRGRSGIPARLSGRRLIQLCLSQPYTREVRASFAGGDGREPAPAALDEWG